MATRNLTMHFLRARSEALRRRPAVSLDHFGEPSGSVGGGGGAFGSGAAHGDSGYDTRSLARPPPVYVDVVDEVNRIIDSIEKKSAWRWWRLRAPFGESWGTTPCGSRTGAGPAPVPSPGVTCVFPAPPPFCYCHRHTH